MDHWCAFDRPRWQYYRIIFVYTWKIEEYSRAIKKLRYIERFKSTFRTTLFDKSSKSHLSFNGRSFAIFPQKIGELTYSQDKKS